MKVLIKFNEFTNIYDLKFLDNETTSLWLFFEICVKEPFASQILSNEGNIKASILLTLLKGIVVGYSNGNDSFAGRLFSSCGLLNMLFHFFDIYGVFHETFVKKFMKKLSFFRSNFKNQFQDVVYYRKLRCLTLAILKWRPFEYNVKIWKICPFLGLFFQKWKTQTFWILWIKYFGNDLWFLIKWHIWV